MTVEEHPVPIPAPRRRMPLPVWIALGVAVVLVLASLLVLVNRPGVPTLVPGQKGAAHMPSTS
jgi:hypothetical protein